MRIRTSLAALLVALAVSPAGRAQTLVQRHASAEAQAQRAALQASRDPFAEVYVVTSRATHAGIRRFVDRARARRDGMGTSLVVARTRAHRLEQISAYVHERENRCGGYFAFATRAQAERFVSADRSRRAISATPASALAAYTLDSQETVGRWLPQVAERNLYDTINHLQSYQNRWYASGTGVQAAEWIRARWQSLAGPRTDVTSELFTACGNCGGQPSVILTVRGVERPDEVVVLGAHLDSINRNGGGATQRAPGADDDASGIAVLTETLRVALAQGWRPQRTVKVMGYAAEEVGLRGSNAIAQAHRATGTNVVAVLQVDMTNYKAGSPVDMRLVTDYSNEDLKSFSVALFDAYLAPLGITRGTLTCGYACSDHASWTAAGYPSAMMYEAGDASGRYPYIHTTEDTLQTMGESAQNSVKFAQFALAFLGETAKTTQIPSMSTPLPPESLPPAGASGASMPPAGAGAPPTRAAPLSRQRPRTGWRPRSSAP